MERIVIYHHLKYLMFLVYLLLNWIKKEILILLHNTKQICSKEVDYRIFNQTDGADTALMSKHTLKKMETQIGLLWMATRMSGQYIFMDYLHQKHLLNQL